MKFVGFLKEKKRKKGKIFKENALPFWRENILTKIEKSTVIND